MKKLSKRLLALFIKTALLPLSFRAKGAVFISALCGMLSGCDGPKPDFGVSIASPKMGASVATWLNIHGGYIQTGSAVTAVRVELMRYSDGLRWTGTEWGGASITLPTTLTPGTKTWQCAAVMPAGALLADGTYLVTAHAEYSIGRKERTDAFFTVGVVAPPVMPTLYGWGWNTDGRLGAGVFGAATHLTPVYKRGVLDGKVLVAVSAGGSHTMALTSEGRVYAWGYNGNKQLGLGSGTQPVEVHFPALVELSGRKIESISAGASHSLAADDEGRVFAWGSNYSGELGNGTTGVEASVPVQIGGILSGKKIIQVIAGQSLSLALSDQGEVFAWGKNNEGQLGIGSTTDSSAPVLVAGALAGAFISSVSAGLEHTLALTSDGKVYAWGNNSSGQLGIHSLVSSHTPVLVGGLLTGRTVTAISAGDYHNLVLADNKVYTWGKATAGRLGTTTQIEHVAPPVPEDYTSYPVELGDALAGKKLVRVAASKDFSFAFTEDNQVYAWGNNLIFPTIPGLASGVYPLPTVTDFSSALSGGRVILGFDLGGIHGMILTGFPPLLQPEIEVEAQDGALVDGVSSNQILFGSQANGSTKSEWITVRNSGTSDLSEFDVEISGMNSSDFFAGFSSQPPLKPNAVTGFYLHFKPTATGSREATLRIRSNDPDEDPFDINVIGTGYEPGKPEPGFNAGLNSYAYTTVVQPDGKILIGGGFTSIQPVGTATPQPRGYIARLNADGTLDTAFHPNVNNTVHSIAVQHDGKILIGGYFTSLQPGGTGASFTRHNLARLNADGTVDTGFAVNVNGFIRCILPQRDGRILIGGQFYQINDGSGTVTRNRIARLHENGTLDTGFNPNANGEVLTMALDSQNRIVVGGYFSSIGGATRYKLARLDPDGFADGFNPVSSSFVNAVAMESDGSVLVGGQFTEALPGGGTASNLLRVKPDDTLDATFKPNPGYRIQGISVQADRSILISGSFTAVQPFGDPTPTTRNRMARLFPDGSLDVYFNPDANGEVYGSAIQADGKIIPAGSFNTMGGDPRNGTARLSNNTVTDILTVQSLGSIQWQRGGGAPETTDVRFDLSIDGGSTWSPLAGTAIRSPTGWEQTGFTLPTSGRIRARARTTSGNHNGSSGLVEKITIYSDVPTIAVYKDGLLHNHLDSHQYGVVATGGGAAIKVFTIQNAGGGTLTGFTNAIIEDELSEPDDDASNFRLTMSSYPSSLANGESTTIAVRYQPKTTGDHYALLRIPSNDHSQPEFFILLKGTGSLPITTWKQIHFGQTENTGAAEDTATNEAGITRLEAYAQNLNPHTATSDTTSVTGPGGGGGGGFAPFSNGSANLAPPGNVFFFHYQRNKLALADVQFQVEWSDTLATNDWHTDDVTEEILSDDGSTQQVKATVPTGTAGHRFVRLKMTRP